MNTHLKLTQDARKLRREEMRTLSNSLFGAVFQALFAKKTAFSEASASLAVAKQVPLTLVASNTAASRVIAAESPETALRRAA
jgi:hypothetical protein